MKNCRLRMSLLSLACLSLVPGQLSAFDWSTSIPALNYNQWVLTSDSSFDTYRFEFFTAPFFRMSFKDGVRDYRDNFSPGADGLYWHNGYWKESDGSVLYIDNGVPGIRVSERTLTFNVPFNFGPVAVTEGAQYTPAGGSSTPVTCVVRGSARFMGSTRLFVNGKVYPAKIISLEITVDDMKKQSDGTAFGISRTLTNVLSVVDGYGPVAVENSSSNPAWSYAWNIANFGAVTVPVYGSGLWSHVPADPVTGAKFTGIGWIHDGLYPLVWHYSANEWMWVHPASSPFNIWLWRYGANPTWIWTSDLYGGWHFELPSTWALWN